MHGTIFSELQQFVAARLGEGAWEQLKRNAGIDPAKQYEIFRSYPDEEVGSLVGAASAMTGIAVSDLLEDFGEFIAPDLLEMYWGAIDPAWRTLDVIEHTESTIHAVVRIDHKDSSPPYLKAHRNGENEVAIVYTSPRRLCAVAKGISRGIARHFQETVTIEDAKCMHRGDGECVLVVSKQG